MASIQSPSEVSTPNSRDGVAGRVFYVVAA
jgi:hypothetical protein